MSVEAWIYVAGPVLVLLLIPGAITLLERARARRRYGQTTGEAP